MQHWRSFAAAATALVATTAAAPAAEAMPAPSPVVCRDVVTPVALAPNAPQTDRIYGHLCAPEGTSPDTVQVLVHGQTYDHSYWDFPDPSGHTSRYSYQHAATQRGFATLAIDRIGVGHSSHPPSPAVNIYTNAYTVHQVIQAIRHQRITSDTGKPFHKVAYVGHSYGSWTGWYESDFHDADAYVFTGATRSLTLPKAGTTILANLAPAAVDPRFAPLHLDPGYMTSQPGLRRAMFYDPAPVDPAVVAYDEAHASTTTGAFEIGTFAGIVGHQLDVRAPALLVDGQQDSLFCRPEIGGDDCSSPQALLRQERGHLGPRVPSVDAYTLPGAGHDLNTALDAQDYFRYTQDWISAQLGAPKTGGLPDLPPVQPDRDGHNPLGPVGNTVSGVTDPLGPVDRGLAPAGQLPPLHDLGRHLNPITGALL